MKNLGIKTKLISLFIIIKLIPLIIIAYISFEGFNYLEDIFNKESKQTLENSHNIVKKTAELAIKDSIVALDKKS